MTKNYQELIRLSKSCLSSKETEVIRDLMLHDGYLGMGQEVKKFETLISKMMGRSVVAVNSGTAALHLAVESIISLGDEVLVPSITYVATYQAIVAAGGVPISCDVNISDLCIDLSDAESKITNRTKVILPVLYAGFPGNLEAVNSFGEKHGLRVVIDAAHAFGSIVDDQYVGAKGDIVCFSFDGIKNITCGEGGAVVSSDSNVIDYCMDARLLGVQNDSANRFSGKRSWQFDVTHRGYRYHMSNINAAVGIVQINKLGEFSSRRRAISESYVQKLKAIDCIEPLFKDFTNIVPHIFPIKVDPSIKRDRLRKKMYEFGVETGVHYFPNHLLSFFKKEHSNCPNSELLYDQLLSLPLHPDLSEEDIARVVEVLTVSIEECRT